MRKNGIMSCIDQIPYDKVNVMQTLNEEAIKVLGQDNWREITENIEMPADNMDSKLRNSLTRELMKQIDQKVNPQTAKQILCNTRHGLKHSHFTWARERFLEYNDIDLFCSVMKKENIDGFTQAAESGEYYHGQPVDPFVLQFVIDHPFLLYGARDKNKIKAIAIPCETQKYLKETDLNKKRYYACHCPFASRSILDKEGAVSKTLCNCSLGHTKVFWEATLDANLEGRVINSVLGDGLLCCFEIDLPDEVMNKYVHKAKE
ncbi:hypothetical protein [Anaerocolumna jejuensis]|uniref:hypothetical protein n=1 Tax=Anaerocolumna jejuensis TaxID=259063 RepID=UPI003F7B8045